MPAHKPRVGFLGAGPQEIHLLLELQAGAAIDLLGVYDANPRSPGLAMAELVGVAAGSDDAALERLRAAEYVVLPQDRLAAQDAVRWAAGLRAELVPLPEARRRWAELRGVTPPKIDVGAAERALADAVDASARLQDRSDLADWLLGIAMRSVGANGGSIQMLAAETSELYLVAGRGLSERLVRHGRHRVGEGISGKVAATGAPQMLHGPRPGLPPRERGEIQASISLPLEEDGELVGVLNVSSTVRGRRFGDEHLRALEKLAPRMTRLLRDAARLEPESPRLDLPKLLRKAESDGVDLPGQLALLCQHAGETLAAASVALYLATEDGDWLLAHGQQPEGGVDVLAARRAELDVAFAEGRWVHVTEVGPGPSEDLVAAAVDRALDPRGEHRSHLLCPLDGITRVGVFVLEFDALDAADRCLRTGAAAVDQLAFSVDALLRQHRQNRRLQGHAALARCLQRLVNQVGAGGFEYTLASEAAGLVGARCASVRRVDETARTYSRPVTYGVAEEKREVWRELDRRVTERTLVTRRAMLTTTADDHLADEALEPPHYALISIPFMAGERIMAVLNAYEKQPRDGFESQVFTHSDLELLESLALVAVRLVVRSEQSDEDQRDAPGLLAAEATRPEDEPATRSRETRQPIGLPPMVDIDGPQLELTPVPEAAEFEPEPMPAPEFEVVAEPAPSPERGPVTSLLDALQRAVEDMAVTGRGVGVWVLRFEGLAALGPQAPEARSRLAETVRLGLRTDDIVEWTGDEELTIVGAGLPPENRRLETRLEELVRPQLARLSRVLERGIALRIGSSTYPRDGQIADELLALAVERAR